MSSEKQITFAKDELERIELDDVDYTTPKQFCFGRLSNLFSEDKSNTPSMVRFSVSGYRKKSNSKRSRKFIGTGALDTL